MRAGNYRHMSGMQRGEEIKKKKSNMCGGAANKHRGRKKMAKRDEILLSVIVFLYKVSPTLEEFWDLTIYDNAFLDSCHNVDLYTPKKEGFFRNALLANIVFAFF